MHRGTRQAHVRDSVSEMQDDHNVSAGSLRSLGRRWFAVQTKPFKEFYAAANLENQRFPTFLPRIRKTVRHARRTRAVSAPLFPRYLFVSLDLSHDRWRSVIGTFGVSNLVTGGTRPLPVPPGLVESLIGATNHLSTLDLSDGLVPGQNVRFLAGPFAEMVGHLVRLDGRGRAQVLLAMLGSERNVTVPARDLAPALDSGNRASGPR